MKAITALKGALCAAAVFFLCGCMQSTGLGERAIAKAIYVDFDKGSYEAVLTVMDCKPSADAGAAENQAQLYRGRGKTVGQALSQAENEQSKKAFYGQNDLLFLGKGILKNDITSCLSYFAQENAVRPNLMIFAVEEDADEWMEQKDQMDEIVEQSGLLGVKTHGGQEVSTGLYEFFRQEGQGVSGWIPMLTLHENGLQTIQSLAVVDHGQQTAVLKEEETLLALCFGGKSSELIYNGELDNAPLSFTARGVRTVYEADGTADAPSLKVMVEGEFQEISIDGETLYGEKAKQAAARINDFLQESAKDLEKKTFARGNDIFAFSWWMAQQDAQSVLNAKENGRLYKEQTVSYQFHLSAPKA